MQWLTGFLDYFMTQIKRQHTYRNSKPTTSLLTITSNVVYGKQQGTRLTDVVPANLLHQVRTQVIKTVNS